MREDVFWRKGGYNTVDLFPFIVEAYFWGIVDFERIREIGELFHIYYVEDELVTKIAIYAVKEHLLILIGVVTKGSEIDQDKSILTLF